MRTIFSRCILTLLLGILPLWLSAQELHTLGYCDDDLENADMIGVDGEARLSGAIRLPLSTMQRYKGGRVVRIRVALREGIDKPSVWIRTSLNESSKVVQSISHPVNGWNEVELNTPYTIDGGDLYIGYSFTQPDGVRGILAKGEGHADSSLLAINNEWADYHTDGVGILFIQAIAEAELPGQDLGVVTLLTDSLCYSSTSTLQTSAMIENLGTQSMTGYTLKWSIDGETRSESFTDDTLSPGDTQAVAHLFDLTDLAEGEHYAELTIVAADTDEKGMNDTLRQPFYIYADTYAHQVLLEHFTSLPCVNCPPVDHLLESVMETRDDVVWVSHHVGYRTDEFTIEASEPYTLFGVLGNPYIMLDRSQFIGETPAFTISNFTSSDLNLAFDMVRSHPALVTLSATLNADGRQLSIAVEGTSKPYFRPLYPRATLNVFIVEDDVLAEGSQAGDANKKRHDNITRAILTRKSGDLIRWTGDTTFAGSYTAEAPESWDLSHLRVVAFVTSAAERATGYPTGEVLNSTQAPLNSSESIVETCASHLPQSRYFTIGGQPLADRPQYPGIYITVDGNGHRQKTYIR